MSSSRHIILNLFHTGKYFRTTVCVVFSGHPQNFPYILDPAAAFLYRLAEKHDVADTEFLVDGAGYLTALARHELSGQLNYTERNHIEKRFQTVTMRIDRFHSFWRGSQSSARRWLRRFRHYYNRNRLSQALAGRTPAEVVLN